MKINIEKLIEIGFEDTGVIWNHISKVYKGKYEDGNVFAFYNQKTEEITFFPSNYRINNKEVKQ